MRCSDIFLCNLLEEAAIRGDINLIKSLTYRINPRFGYMHGILMIAIKYGHISIVKYLIEVFGVNVDEYCCLKEAAESTQLEILKYFIEELGLDINKNEEIFVHATNGLKSLNMLKYLVSKEVNINSIDYEPCYSALALAATIYKNIRLVKYLVEEVGVYVDDYISLSNAVFGAPFPIIKYLIEKGAKVSPDILPDDELLMIPISTQIREYIEEILVL